MKTSGRRGVRPLRAAVSVGLALFAPLLAAPLLAVPGLAVAASASDLLYERAVMTAADGRCKLFAPPVRAALAAAQAQARGAALRGGADPVQLDGVQASASRKAASVACTSADIRTASARVRRAFEGYARLYRLTYPGDVASWTAARNAPSDRAGWQLAQNTRFGADQAVFGLAGKRGETPQLAIGAVFADGATPYAARLVIRDPARLARPTLGGARPGPTARLPLASRVSPRAATRQFMAASRASDAALSPAAKRDALVFRFPATASSALAGLDPREAVSVEFLFAGRGRDQVRTALFEVGDFAAGRAFLAAG